MIRDLSRTLRALLIQPGLPPELTNAQVVFDPPSDTFRPAQTSVDLFLYNIRENVELRNPEPIVSRNGSQATIQRPALRVECSYLVTAWAVGGTEQALQEHRLLSQALQVLSRYPTIPASFLQDSLVGQDPPLPMLTAQTDGLKNPAEFWTALGTRLRPSFSVAATISMSVFPPETAPLVITSEVQLEQLGAPATQVALFRIGGRVTDAGGSPVAGATVTLVEPGLAQVTDADGQFTIGTISAGTYTLRVAAGATVKQVSVNVPATAGSNYNVQLT
ncbi:MAG TPA: Pvc16 family protein [Bryobacteraceae bacterium]|nr:Pvc16 family protein [Bryobacteraceae bacterium]